RLPEALESVRPAWESIPAGDRERFAGVVGLCVDVKGDLIGTPFPEDVLDTTYTDLTHLHAVRGDKAGLGQTEVVRRFPFPVIPGETLTAEHVVYARMS